MTKFMEIRLENAFIGQSSDPKLQRLMFPWTGTQGPLINGKLIINHREDITLRGLTLTFTATISCSWSEKRGNSTTYYSAKKPLMEKSWVFLERAENKLHMLRANQTYTYDFQLALPVNLPNSLSMGTGKIEYKFSANGKRSTFSLDLERERIVEIYQSLPPQHNHCLYPIQQTADWEQAMNYLIQIPKRAFHHGSTLPITVRMHPLMGSVARWYVKDMSMKVKEYFWFISPGKGTRHEKRTILESKQGSGSWPIQTGPVERTLSFTIPATNVMTTVDTEIVKCTHKLKLMFHIDVNGSTRKLPVEFDLYIPGPFPPGQGPLGLPPAQQPLPLVPQVQQPLPPLPQMQQPPLQYQQPLPALPPQQQQPLPPAQHTPPHHAAPPPAQSPYGPGYPVMPQYMAPPMAPLPFQTPVMSPPSYSTGSQTPSSTYSHVPAHNPFSPPVTPYQPTTAVTGPSTPGSTATPHPYSQGYPTPTAPHAYPSVSSQGYPTPGLPMMPSPKVPSYPLPPSPSPMAAAAASGMQMPVPSPTPAHSVVSPPPAQVKTPVMSHQQQQQQQQQQYPVPPLRTTSTSTSNNSITAPKITAPPVAVSSAVVMKTVNDDIKVDVEDFRIPSIPSTPAMSATSPNGGASQTPPPSGSSGSGSGPISQTHSQNPQTQQVLPSRNPQQRHSFGVLGADPLNNGNSYQPPPPTTSTQPHGPHAIKTLDSDINTQYSYHPPPPSSTMSSSAGSNGVPSPKNTHNHNSTLEHRFSQMGFANSPLPPSPATSSAALVTSPMMSSPLSHPGASLSHSTSVSSTYPMSPVSAAATGAVVAHHQQQQQQYQQQYQPPPPLPVASMPPPSQHQQYQHQQSMMPSQHHMPQQHPVQQPPPQKQQVWIPMYQTLGGKTYVQYVLTA